MENSQKQFLGSGWCFPPTFCRDAFTVKMASGDVDIKQSIWIILSTQLRERIMLPQFGSQISEMTFHSMDTTGVTQLKEMVKAAILEWEPRVDVISVDVQPYATLEGALLIEVHYDIRKTNARSNLVYPFHIDEGTIPPEAPRA